MEVQMYNKGLTDISQGLFYWITGGDTIKAVIMTEDYEFDETHETYNDLSNEVSAMNYTVGGQTLTVIDPAVISVEDRIIMDANDLTIEDFTVTFRKIAIVDAYWNPAHLICFIDLGENITPVGDYTFVWNKNGFIDIMAKTN